MKRALVWGTLLLSAFGAAPAAWAAAATGEPQAHERDSAVAASSQPVSGPPPTEGDTAPASGDPERLAGTWYEIARYDHPFERRLSQVVIRCRFTQARLLVELSGTDYRTGRHRRVRRVLHARSDGHWHVMVLGISVRPLMAVATDEASGWAVVGSPGSRLWILARTPVLPARTLGAILRRVDHAGFSSRRLVFVDQGY